MHILQRISIEIKKLTLLHIPCLVIASRRRSNLMLIKIMGLLRGFAPRNDCPFWFRRSLKLIGPAIGMIVAVQQFISYG
jgi:hypothetical protein